MNTKIKDLKTFYAHYLLEHQNRTSRNLHFVGTTSVILLFLAAIIWKQWWLLILLPVVGYGFAWAGHFYFEKNKPATFRYPLYSLICDFIMFWDILNVQIDQKIEQAKKGPKQKI